MSTLDLSSYSRESLEHILSVMKGYRTSLKQIGKRARLIDTKDILIIRAIVEYAPGMDVSSVKSYAASSIKQLFPDYTGEAPTLRENTNLKGGARVFVGDDMVDISYQRFETLFKK